MATTSETLYLDPILLRLNIYYGDLIWRPNIYRDPIISIYKYIHTINIYIYIYSLHNFRSP